MNRFSAKIFKKLTLTISCRIIYISWGLTLFLYSGILIIKQSKYSSYLITEGTLASVEKVYSGEVVNAGRVPNPVYNTKKTYCYSVNGVIYTGVPDFKTAETPYRSGKAIFYNPEHPDQFTLSRAIAPSTGKIIISALFVVIVVSLSELFIKKETANKKGKMRKRK